MPLNTSRHLNKLRYFSCIKLIIYSLFTNLIFKLDRNTRKGYKNSNHWLFLKNTFEMEHAALLGSCEKSPVRDSI